MAVSHVSHTIRTRGKNGERLFSVTPWRLLNSALSPLVVCTGGARMAQPLSRLVRHVCPQPSSCSSLSGHAMTASRVTRTPCRTPSTPRLDLACRPKRRQLQHPEPPLLHRHHGRSRSRSVHRLAHQLLRAAGPPRTYTSRLLATPAPSLSATISLPPIPARGPGRHGLRAAAYLPETAFPSRSPTPPLASCASAGPAEPISLAELFTALQSVYEAWYLRRACSRRVGCAWPVRSAAHEVHERERCEGVRLAPSLFSRSLLGTAKNAVLAK